MEWIKLSERLPGKDDGLCQLWLPKEGLGGLVVGYDAKVFQPDVKDPLIGVWDIHKQGVWDYADFLYWMKFPSLPSDFPSQTFMEFVTNMETFYSKA
jgi:hypothetical protein